jgi:hypothetical protein
MPPYYKGDRIDWRDVTKFRGTMMMKKLLIAIAATTFAVTAFAQVEPAVKESAKATAESAKEAGDNAKAAVSSQPHKSMDKAKARVHRAKAHVHRHQAKKAADAAVH